MVRGESETSKNLSEQEIAQMARDAQQARGQRALAMFRQFRAVLQQQTGFDLPALRGYQAGADYSRLRAGAYLRLATPEPDETPKASE